jgi:predicted NBD/HSP70 family sugar kinase
MLSSLRSQHGQMISVNSKVVRNINRATILNCIRERQPISRSEIARATRLNKSTVSSIVAGLLRDDLVAEKKEKSKSVGRNPIGVSLRKGKNFYGAIAIDSPTTRIAVVDIDGTIVHTDKLQTRNGQAQEFIDECCAALNGLRIQNNLSQFKGIGVSVAGIVDPQEARVLFSSILDWENVPLGSLLKAHYPDAVVTAVENDAKAAALAELWFGTQNINSSNYVFLSVGRGIGAGIVIDRRILGGESHLAGEVGHITLVEGGEPCGCGNRGCWEAYASDLATVRRYAAAKRMDAEQSRALTIDDVIAAVRRGDEDALRELKASGRSLGHGIANVVKAVDPATIVVGGHITRVWDLIADDVNEAAHQRSFVAVQSFPRIVATTLTKRPALLGAAALVMRKSFGEVRVTV